MQLKATIVLLISFAVSASTWSQRRSENDTVKLSFNSQGLLTSFPGNILTKEQPVCFTVKTPIRFLQTEMEQFQSRIQKMLDTINRNRAAYDCYYKDAAKFDLQGFLTKASKFNDQMKSFWSCTENGIAAHFSRNLTDSILARTTPMDHIPAKDFLANMLENQFEIQVVTQDGVARTIKLKADRVNCTDSCVYFTSVSCEKISKLLCTSCGDATADSIRFRLIRTDPFTKTLSDWFDSQRKTASEIEDWEGITATLAAIAEDQSSVASLVPALDTLKYKVFPYWLWYAGGKLTLDPFSTMDPDKIKSLTDQVENLDTQINRLKKLKIFTDSISVKVQANIDNIAVYKKVQDSTAKYEYIIDSLTARKKSIQKKLDGKNNSYPSTQIQYYLNNVKLVLSDKKVTRIQKQFDASRKYGEIFSSRKQLDRITEVPEDESVYLILYNIDSASKIEINQSRTNFDDLEHFTKLVKEQLGSVNISALAVPAVEKFQSFVETFLPSQVRHAIQLDSTNPCQSIHANIIAIAKKLAAGESTSFYAKSFFSEKVPDVPLYRTEDRRLGAGYATPYTDTVSVEQTSAGVKSKELVTYINTGKLRFVKLAAGIAFTSHPATTSSIDTSGNGFKITSSDNQAVAIFGFKVYPWQSYNRDKWLLPRYPLRRLSIFGGFDLLHPLDNFFLGGGYDIVPGLSFTVGANFYLQESYKIENNTVTDTYRNYKLSGPYYGVTVNPELFVQFVKLFFQ